MFIIVMKNCFGSENEMDAIFDLKGSEIGRITEEKDKKPGEEIKAKEKNICKRRRTIEEKDLKTKQIEAKEKKTV